jgi:hypothetical protein
MSYGKNGHVQMTKSDSFTIAHAGRLASACPAHAPGLVIVSTTAPAFPMNFFTFLLFLTEKQEKQFAGGVLCSML